MRKTALILLLTLFSTLPWDLWNPSPAQGRKARVVVLNSHSIAPYQSVFESFRQALPGLGIQADVESHSFQGDATKSLEVMEKAKLEEADLVLTLGAPAAERAAEKLSDVPIVEALILSMGSMREKKNITGVVLDIPTESILPWIKTIIPNLKDIGIIYNPAKNAEKVEEAQRSVSSAGFVLHAQQVGKPSDLPAALEILSKKIDALWGLPDDMVYNAQTAKHILLFSMENKIPFVGLSEAWVKAGALFSVDADYADMGEQCAEMAAKILTGQKPDSIAPSYPRKYSYSINLKTADIMKLSIPDSVVEGAHQVFR